MEDKLLEKIESPQDIKNLSVKELENLSDEIRQEIVSVVSKNGGHLSPNLGIVELTVALHKVFDSPKDKIVFDVGHQCYAHKMLTGRYKQMDTLRKEGGLSGFPSHLENPNDAFGAGHSSTSISAAYGLQCANILNDDDSYVVAVIGDGALSGGLAFEGLNNAGRSKKNFIVVLNDNKMSISKNVGSMARYLTSIRVNPSYLNTKSKVERFLTKVPVIGKGLLGFFRGLKNFIKRRVFKSRTIFEDMGFYYYGPFDGHNIGELITALNAAKRKKGPVLIHAVTTKGKGYEFAEKNPKGFHGTAPFDVDTGLTNGGSKSYSDVFGETLCQIAEKNEKICAITAAMQLGTGLSSFAQKYKSRFFDVGIAEEHAVTFGCGLAMGGMIPVFAVYSTFLQRSYDQIIHDASIQKLHIILAIDRAGIVGEDGKTHQGLFDTSFLNNIPNVTILCPSYFDELRFMLKNAIYNESEIVAVRYPRGRELYKPKNFLIKDSKYVFFGDEKSDILIITYGRLFSFACECMERLEKQGISACILKLNTVKPIDSSAVIGAKDFKYCFFFEEGICCGGIGEHFLCKLIENDFTGKYTLTAIDDQYVEQSTVASALKKYKLDTDGMEEVILKKIKCDGELCGKEKT